MVSELKRYLPRSAGGRHMIEAINIALYAAFAVIGGFIGLFVSIVLFTAIEFATRKRLKR